MNQKAPPSPELLQAYNRAVSDFKAKKYLEVEQVCQQLASVKPDFFEAVYLLGVVQSALDKSELALASYNRAIELRPDFAEAHYNRGNILKKLHRLDEAVASYDRTIALRPDYATAFSNRGNTLAELKRFDEALTSLNRALALKPDLAEALYNRGNTLAALNKLDEALVSYDRALMVRPNYAKALYNRGNTLARLKRFDEALGSYDRALAAQPNYGEALYNRANTLRELNRLGEALVGYDRVLSVRPNDAEALSNRGVTLHELRRYDDALVSFDRAVELRPDDPEVLFNRANTLSALRRYDEALAAYDQVLAKKPDHAYALSGAAFSAINLCDWAIRETFEAQLIAAVGKKVAISPFVMLGYSDDPELQLQCARNYIEKKVPVLSQPLWVGQTWHHDKIRIAYLSADFHSHATSSLMAELFERHDRSRFEIIGISFGIDDKSETRKRVVSSFDAFHDVRQKSDREVANLLRDSQVDIAIDLKGYTLDARPEILAFRPAPIQVTYLGYPGTTGSQFINYIIADQVVAPFDHQRFYTEKIVQLPDCYQPNDTKRKVAEHAPTRKEAGLPDDKIVFCCFNNNWKITPATFDVWMRLLSEVKDSILWLLSDNPGAERNLRKEAANRGIDASRLIFAPRLPLDEHLARHKLADLFLDTLPCNAHTTASDALWMGLPVLTCEGDAFAARVAASLLRAIGAGELIATNMEEYEALALKFARDPALLAALKAKILRNRESYPLFNSKRFVQHIEAAYIKMWNTWHRGEPPTSFRVEQIG